MEMPGSGISSCTTASAKLAVFSPLHQKQSYDTDSKFQVGQNIKWNFKIYFESVFKDWSYSYTYADESN